MRFLFIAGALIYYICLIVISVRLFDGVLRKIFIGLSFLIYIPTSIMSLNISNEQFLLMILALNVIQIAFAKLFIKKIHLSTLIYSFLLLFCFSIVLIAILISFISISSHIELIIGIVVHLLMITGCLTVCFTSIQSRIKTVIRWTPNNIKLIMISLITMSMIIVVLLSDIQRVAQNEALTFLTHQILLVLIILVCSTFPILVLKSVENTYLKRLSESYEEQIKAQAEHYSALSKANFELRRFRHDFNNIRIGVEKLVSDGKYTEAVSMLDSSNADFYNTTNTLLLYNTGNGIVDALLSDKQQKAADSDIKINFEGTIPQNIITPTELCVLFGNTVDNAIEACERLSANTEKIIKVICKYDSSFIFLSVINPITESVKINNNTLSTTKTNKKLHGFGLYSLDKIVKSRDGKLKLYCDNGEFRVNICLLVG